MSEEDVFKKARDTANEAPEVKAANLKVKEAGDALAADPTNKELRGALDAAVHAEATAMSNALISALLKVEGGRRRKTRKSRKSRRSTRKSRRYS